MSDDLTLCFCSRSLEVVRAIYLTYHKMKRKLLLFLLLAFGSIGASFHTRLEAQQTKSIPPTGKARAKAQAESVERWLRSNGYNPSVYRDDSGYIVNFRSQGYDIEVTALAEVNQVGISISHPLSEELDYWAGLYANDQVTGNSYISSYYRYDKDGKLIDLIHGWWVVGFPQSVPGIFLEMAIENIHTSLNTWQEAYSKALKIQEQSRPKETRRANTSI